MNPVRGCVYLCIRFINKDKGNRCINSVRDLKKEFVRLLKFFLSKASNGVNPVSGRGRY